MEDISVKKYQMLNQERVSSEEVITAIVGEKDGTAWASRSSQWTIDYVKHLTEVYGEVWHSGFLPKDLLGEILLPRHTQHDQVFEENAPAIFPLDTPLSEAVKKYREYPGGVGGQCQENISFLKDEIQKNGFTTAITLGVINDILKHVDGLHRLLALALLVDEGYEYEPIPVFICDNTA